MEDILLLPGKEDEVCIHPNVFHNVLDEATVNGWQGIQEPSRLRVLLAGVAPGVSAEEIRAGVAAALTSSGVVRTQVEVLLVQRVERTALGKAPFVRGMPQRP